MSIIETAYEETVAARLCTAIEALEVATAAYQTTGNALIAATTAEYDTHATYEYAETNCRWLTHADDFPGKNAAERKTNLDMYVLDSEPVIVARDDWERARAALYFAERQHKNAYHGMDSLRTAIAGYAAVLGALKD